MTILKQSIFNIFYSFLGISTIELTQHELTQINSLGTLIIQIVIGLATVYKILKDIRKSKNNINDKNNNHEL